jgi:hypothetical protein
MMKGKSMDETRKKQVSEVLTKLADSLDIPESRYKEAEERYQAVGKWLKNDESPLAPYKPEIYPQGSFRLGTVIKPINDGDKYDIDLVCELNLTKEDVTQHQLKQKIGDRLKENKTYEKMLAPEGRRCWTLEYADGAKFHMDILPAIPDGAAFRVLLESRNLTAGWSEDAIAITDTAHENYEHFTDDWPCSNPRGYSSWFKERMKVRFENRRMQLAESLQANIEDVPEYKVKTPLQQAIQILKRHRDIRFADDTEDRPISIIITTLAARAYNNETDLLDALINIVDGMPAFIESRAGDIWVPNPVNPLENFADKWKEHPQRKKKFMQWLACVQADLQKALSKSNPHEIATSLGQSFGEKTMLAIAAKMMLRKAPVVLIENPCKPWRCTYE